MPLGIPFNRRDCFIERDGKSVGDQCRPCAIPVECFVDLGARACANLQRSHLFRAGSQVGPNVRPRRAGVWVGVGFRFAAVELGRERGVNRRGRGRIQAIPPLVNELEPFFGSQLVEVDRARGHRSRLVKLFSVRNRAVALTNRNCAAAHQNNAAGRHRPPAATAESAVSSNCWLGGAVATRSLHIHEYDEHERRDGAQEQRKEKPDEPAMPFALGESRVDQGERSPTNCVPTVDSIHQVLREEPDVRCTRLTNWRSAANAVQKMQRARGARTLRPKSRVCQQQRPVMPRRANRDLGCSGLASNAQLGHPGKIREPREAAAATRAWAGAGQSGARDAPIRVWPPRLARR
jgi:hypothetical protein